MKLITILQEIGEDQTNLWGLRGDSGTWEHLRSGTKESLDKWMPHFVDDYKEVRISKHKPKFESDFTRRFKKAKRK